MLLPATLGIRPPASVDKRHVQEQQCKVTDGYLDNEEETKEAFTADGWFKTGDIGEWAPNGQVRIIDRKKNLVKTSNGEYIALEKLESVYRSDPVVHNICVYADQSKIRPIAVIVPVEATLKKLAAEHGIHKEHLQELKSDKKLISNVLKQLQETGRGGKLKGIEIIDGVVLTEEEWTPQSVSFDGPLRPQQKRKSKN